MTKWTHRRKLSNFILDAAALLRLSAPFLTITVISIGIVFTVRVTVIKALKETVLVGVENLATMNALLDLQRSVTSTATIGLIVLSIFCLAFWVVISHRIFGPIVPIRRHIKKLSEGDYSSRITVRARDEFKELASELNHLAEALAKKAQK